MEDELNIIYQIAIDNIRYYKNKQRDTISLCCLCFGNIVYRFSLCGTII